MKICRFNGDRLGLVEGDRVYDVSAALDAVPPSRWPDTPGDPLIASLSEIKTRIGKINGAVPSLKISEVRLGSIVTRPSKIMAAPANYRAHVEQDTRDPGVDQGVHRKALEGVERPVDKFGLFLKANSALAGPSDGIVVALPDRRCDHEIEIAVIIGRGGANIPRAQAGDHIAGYCLGLDMTYRGVEDRSFRKSADTFALIGPWLVTADEINNPADLEFWLAVNGKERQRSSTAQLTVGIDELIEMASRMYALNPGDILLTGTPEGVGPVAPADIITAGAAAIGEMTVHVRGPAMSQGGGDG